MRNTAYAVTTKLKIQGDYSAQFVSVFADSKKQAKIALNGLVMAGFISSSSAEIKEIDPTDWTITIHNPTIPNSYPLPIAKGSQFYAEAEYNAGLFRQILPSNFIVEVVRFNETYAYRYHSENTTTTEQGGVYA
ncbi:hypothetical protein ACWIYZ_07725 [Ursidibacter arcticus]